MVVPRRAAMSGALARTRKPAGMSPSWKRTVGAVLSPGASAAERPGRRHGPTPARLPDVIETTTLYARAGGMPFFERLRENTIDSVANGLVGLGG